MNYYYDGDAAAAAAAADDDDDDDAADDDCYDDDDDDGYGDDPFQKNGSFLFLSDSCFKIGQAFILNVSLGIHL